MHCFHRHGFHRDHFEDALLAMRRRHGHGLGGFAAGFMGGAGLAGAAFRGRKLGSSDLQLVLLALLAEQPSHGYELIKALEERSGGFYSPSPGMVYPALTYLEEVGRASVEADGTKKLHSITSAGRDYLEANREAADAMLGQLAFIGRKMGRVREFFGDDEDEHGGAREVWHARRELREALREMRHVTADEAKRIAAILLRAAADVRKPK